MAVVYLIENSKPEQKLLFYFEYNTRFHLFVDKDEQKAIYKIVTDDDSIKKCLSNMFRDEGILCRIESCGIIITDKSICLTECNNKRISVIKNINKMRFVKRSE